MYQVKWEGYEKRSDMTWEPEENLLYVHNLDLVAYDFAKNLLVQTIGRRNIKSIPEERRWPRGYPWRGCPKERTKDEKERPRRHGHVHSRQ
jgi:chromobox protein 1